MSEQLVASAEIFSRIIVSGLGSIDPENRRRVLAAVHAYYEADPGSPGPKEATAVDLLPTISLLLGYEDLEERKLAVLVGEFAKAMYERLLAKKRQGFTGWNNTSDPTYMEYLKVRLNRSYAKWTEGRKDSMVDVANYAAFIWNLGRGGVKP